MICSPLVEPNWLNNHVLIVHALSSIKMAYLQIYFLFTSIPLIHHVVPAWNVHGTCRVLLEPFQLSVKILFVITIPSVVCRYIDPTSGWQRAD